MSTYIVYVVELIVTIELWLHIEGAVFIHSTELTARNNVAPPLFHISCTTASSSYVTSQRLQWNPPNLHFHFVLVSVVHSYII